VVVVYLGVALLAVVAASRALRPLCRLTGQPTVVADMAAGILLGPSLLGWLAPALSGWLFPPDAVAPLTQIAQAAVVLYMFLVGVELDFEHARAQLRSISGVAVAGVAVPVALGALLAIRLDPGLMPAGPPLWQAALFLGVAMAMTAFPVLARILADTGLMATPLGTRALSCAAMADVIVWAAVGVVVGAFEQGADAAALAPVVALAFVGGMLLVVRPLVARATLSRIGRGPLGLPLALTAVLVVALVAEAAGVHAVVGAFLLGIGVPHESALARTVDSRLSLAIGLVLPAFFAIAGLRTQIGLVQGISGWLTCLAIIMVATIGKWGATTVAARISGSRWMDATRLGVLMNVRGLMELVVLNVGLDLGLVSPPLYTMMVLMALTTTVMAVPLIHVLAKGAES
jgi:Kef-type K+ transport system membrane component KefB